MNLLNLTLAKTAINLANLGVVALFLSAVTGAASAFLAHRQTKRLEKTKASTDSVTTLEGLVDRYRKEVERVDAKLNDAIKELEICKDDKIDLQHQLSLKADK